ncbi:MAG: sugar phosphate nucleotidyltransferase [Spirochaetaceae bacterium]|nr:sugar phosphate nucleotidyltransferase [Spirochaetaceae bacterium]
MDTLILFGGLGSRLSNGRKIINSKVHSGLNVYYNEVGPKALAGLTINGQSRPLLDYQLAIQRANGGSLYLGLGALAAMVQLYCSNKFGASYYGQPLHYLIEERPAGTVAPLIKMHNAGYLNDKPLLMVNGDNLMDINLAAALAGGLEAARANHIGETGIIDIVSAVPRAASAAYGVLDINHSNNLAVSFKEKQAAHLNPYQLVDGAELCYVNSGFSFIINPLAFFNKYVTKEIIELSAQLEAGRLNYKENEKLVKYESLYEKVAAAGQMAVVKHYGYWSDSGSEEDMLKIEANYQPDLPD